MTSFLPSDYLVEINKVLLSIADTELLVNAPELSIGEYENFNVQEELLTVITMIKDGFAHSLLIAGGICFCFATPCLKCKHT